MSQVFRVTAVHSKPTEFNPQGIPIRIEPQLPAFVDGELRCGNTIQEVTGDVRDEIVRKHPKLKGAELMIVAVPIGNGYTV